MRSASTAVVKHNPKHAKVNRMNAAQAEDSSDVIMGNLPVNDIPAKFLFDSGASHSFLSFPFASEHNFGTKALPKALQVVSPAKRLSSSMVVLDVPIMMGDFKFPASPMVLGNSDIDLILGMDWLSKHKAHLDCVARQIQLTHSFDDVIIFTARDETIRLFSLNEKHELNAIS